MIDLLTIKKMGKVSRSIHESNMLFYRTMNQKYPEIIDCVIKS